MSLHADLLEQARHLARREPRRPRQASLRRAISAAYYALFHLLVSDAARLLASGSQLPEIRPLLSRAFDHGEMLKASRSFSGGNLPAHIASVMAGIVVPPMLQSVATAFVDLQGARHLADYDPAIRLTRIEIIANIQTVERAFADWDAVRQDPAARLYLVALFAWDEFRR